MPIQAQTSHLQKDFCLSEENGKLTLRKDHTYYYQVQCQLLVSKADFCNFMVWTTADFAVVRVEPSKKFAALIFATLWC